MAVLTAVTASITGAALSYRAADAAGDTLDGPVSDTVVHVRNTSTAAVTVTVDVPGATHGQANPDVPVVVAAGAQTFVGPFPHTATDPNGRVALRYSAAAGVEVAALYVGGA